MKKIVPFRKEIEFNTEVAEITSISLENTLEKRNDYLVNGEFILSGEYKIVDVSVNTEKFNYNLPFDINIDSHYDTSELIIDIDDFYYELIDNKMIVNISVLLDKLEEKEIEEKVEVEALEERKEIVEEAKEIFTTFDETAEAYRTYKVYIVRENDTLENVLERFNTTKEKLEDYNDISNITVGSKLIIPTNKDEKL